LEGLDSCGSPVFAMINGNKGMIYPGFAQHESALRSPTRAITFGVLWVGIMLSPLSDFLSVYALKGQANSDVDARFSLFLRGAIVAVALVSMLCSGCIRLSSYRIFLMMSVTVAMSCVSLAMGDITGGELVAQIVVIAKVFSVFIYAAALSDLDDRQVESIAFAMRVALFIYAVSIIAGACFSIDMFRSYRGDTQIRAGYKGIVYAQNEASALLLAGMALAYIRVLRDGWRRTDVVFAATIFVAAFLLGTKGAIVACLGVFAAYSYARFGVAKATMRVMMLVGILSCGVAAVYLLSPAVRQAIDLSISYFTYHGDHAGGGKVATVLLSGRNVKFANVWDALTKQSFMPLLIGGYPTARYQIEMDGPDLALIMGIPLFIVYINDIFKLYLGRGGSRISRFGRYFLALLIILSCTAGHILTSAVVAPYLALLGDLVRRGSRTAHPC
jgi:hypothetical protein